jgi:hypothetical protein
VELTVDNNNPCVRVLHGLVRTVLTRVVLQLRWVDGFSYNGPHSDKSGLTGWFHQGARHLQRSDIALQSLTVSAMATLCSSIPQVPFGDHEIANLESFRVKASTFQASAANADIGVDADTLTEGSTTWGTAGIHDFSVKNCTLLRALLAVSEDEWPCIWINGMFRQHMIVQSFVDGNVFYIASASPHLLLGWELVPLPDSNEAYTLEFVAGNFVEVCITQWDGYLCANYTLELRFSEAQPQWVFTLSDWQHVLRYATCNYIELMHGGTLLSICRHLDIAVSKSSSCLSRIEKIMDHSGATFDEQEVLAAFPISQTNRSPCVRFLRDSESILRTIAGVSVR